MSKLMDLGGQTYRQTSINTSKVKVYFDLQLSYKKHNINQSLNLIILKDRNRFNNPPPPPWTY